MSFKVPEPSSCSFILTYQCSSRCRHCYYAASPAWNTWATETKIDALFDELQKHGRFLSQLIITGGEPMLQPKLTAYAIRAAKERGLPLETVETNAFWCWDDDTALAGFSRLRDAGLEKATISISPFHVEFVPLINTEIAMDAAEQIFGTEEVLLHTAGYFQELHSMDVDDTLELEDYVRSKGRHAAAYSFATDYELIPGGRAAVALADLYERRPAQSYFGESCHKELSSPHHVHIDHMGHYIPGLCTGISLGDARDLEALFSKSDWSDRPVIEMLTTGGVEALLKWAVERHDYQEDLMGYTSKCHLCLDIRRHLVKTGCDLAELAPKPFYDELEHVPLIDVEDDDEVGEDAAE